MEERFKHLNNYLKEKFGERTLKICIDGDFTCPNRDGKLGFGGCIFCSERGSGDHIKLSNNITEQVINYFNSYKSKRANKFIAYFQNYTNTYSSFSCNGSYLLEILFRSFFNLIFSCFILLYASIDIFFSFK